MAPNNHWPNLFKLKPSSPHRQINTSSTMSTEKSCADEGTQKLESNQRKARWKPVPEQIEILEYIFKSGMKNPGREDIQSITKLLQKYGHVREINIYYWFQNKKSRTKRKRRLESASRPTFTPNIREFSSSPSALLPEQMNGTTSAHYHNAVTMGGVIQSDSKIIHTESRAKKRNASVLTVCMNGVPFDASMGPSNGKVLYHSSQATPCKKGFILRELQHGAMYYLAGL